MIVMRQGKKEGNIPLMIMDLEGMEYHGSGMGSFRTQAFTILPNNAQTRYYNRGLGSYQSSDRYYDGPLTYNSSTPVMLLIGWGANQPISTFSPNNGDFFTLTYDGGQKTDIFLPQMSLTVDSYDTLQLYIATTGETYYNLELTDATCTYTNGCISGSAYPDFLSNKTSYLSGGSFTSFISNANNWVGS